MRDLLIRPEDFERCHSRMLEFGMVPSDAGMDIHAAYEVPYGKKGSPLYIELHKHLFPPDSEAYGELDGFFRNVYEQAAELPVYGGTVYTMEYSSHFFYLICHALKHFLHSGFGIRQVCDVVPFCQCIWLPDGLDESAGAVQVDPCGSVCGGVTSDRRKISLRFHRKNPVVLRSGGVSGWMRNRCWKICFPEVFTEMRI